MVFGMGIGINWLRIESDLRLSRTRRRTMKLHMRKADNLNAIYDPII
jgi:hypothetical protein